MYKEKKKKEKKIEREERFLAYGIYYRLRLEKILRAKALFRYRSIHPAITIIKG
ncbi:hypothetical protein P7H71_00260 [Lactococcus lactis]|uniref:hypothetical protein n=1 Tax=Lactococcus lactis TaxID=1358 RepID=UPI00288CD06E|nr:hypothetical protein [Lactococcus lactis]MDT2898976.1 hypothetical protein [Lactococcus lactis]